MHYLETLQKTLKEPVSYENLAKLLQEAQFFFRILRVKLESKDAALRKHAESEIALLKKTLEENIGTLN